MREKEKQILFSRLPKPLRMVTVAMVMLAPWKKRYCKPRQCNKKQRHHFTNKSLYIQSYGFSSSHV